MKAILYASIIAPLSMIKSRNEKGPSKRTRAFSNSYNYDIILFPLRSRWLVFVLQDIP